MWKWVVYAFVGSVVATAGYPVLNARCPLYMHGPGYPIQRIQNDLRLLETAASVFREQHGRDPQSMAEMIEMSIIARAPQDPYDNDYVFRTNGNPRIYSIGLNHRDDGGGVDDIVEGGEYSCPEYYECPSACETANVLLLAGTQLAWLITAALFLVASARSIWLRVRPARR